MENGKKMLLKLKEDGKKKSHKSVKWLPANGSSRKRHCWVHTQVPCRVQCLVLIKALPSLQVRVAAREERPFAPLERPNPLRQRERASPVCLSRGSARSSILGVTIGPDFCFCWDSWDHVVRDRERRATDKAIIILHTERRFHPASSNSGVFVASAGPTGGWPHPFWRWGVHELWWRDKDWRPRRHWGGSGVDIVETEAGLFVGTAWQSPWAGFQLRIGPWWSEPVILRGLHMGFRFIRLGKLPLEPVPPPGVSSWVDVHQRALSRFWSWLP